MDIEDNLASKTQLMIVSNELRARQLAYKDQLRTKWLKSNKKGKIRSDVRIFFSNQN